MTFKIVGGYAVNTDNIRYIRRMDWDNEALVPRSAYKSEADRLAHVAVLNEKHPQVEITFFQGEPLVVDGDLEAVCEALK